MGCKRPYSCCFVGCFFQDLYKIARSILAQFPSSFSQCCLSASTTVAGKKTLYLLSERSDFHMINGKSKAVYAFASSILTSHSVDETLLPEYMNLSSNFRSSSLKVEMGLSCHVHIYYFICVHAEANASGCLL